MLSVTCGPFRRRNRLQRLSLGSNKALLERRKMLFSVVFLVTCTFFTNSWALGENNSSSTQAFEPTTMMSESTMSMTLMPTPSPTPFTSKTTSMMPPMTTSMMPPMTTSMMPPMTTTSVEPTPTRTTSTGSSTTPTSSSTSSSTPATSTSTSSSSQPGPTTNPPPPAPVGVNGGAIAAGILVPLFVIALAAAGVAGFLWWRHRQNKIKYETLPSM